MLDALAAAFEHVETEPDSWRVVAACEHAASGDVVVVVVVVVVAGKEDVERE